MSSPNITTIPLEILIHIASYLNAEEYGAVRLTCKHLEVSLFRTFALQYFSKIQFMRTEFSLQALIDISESRLSSFLKHVAIGTGIISNLGASDGISRVAPRYASINFVTHTDNNLEKQIKYNRFSQLAADQEVFIHTGLDQQMLIRAFRNLDLERVCVCGPCDNAWIGTSEEPFIVATTSYGTSQIFRETSVKLTSSIGRTTRATEMSLTSKCVQSLLYALGESGSKPKRFDIMTSSCSSSDQAFHFPTFMDKTIIPIISGLEAIHWDLDLHHNQYKRLISTPGRVICEIDTYYLRKFLSHAPQIKHLHLGSLYDHDGLFEWIGMPAPTEAYDGPSEFEPPISPMFSQLRELEIVSCSMHAQQLLKVIRKHSATLQKLYVDDTSFFDFDVDAATRFIKGLAQVGRHLKDVHLSFFAAGDHDSPITITGRYSRFGTFSYKGPNMKEELEALKVIGPSPNQYHDEDFDYTDEDEYYESDDYDQFNGFAEFGDYLQEQEHMLGFEDFFDDIEGGLILAASWTQGN
ncbi:hypothetical protein F5Y04DRAFT_244695 [Hypomontagnella monticulosa]|nr:hypothetical protein F5Y04DRAFT_244695 [Hypomontagnella monticulosa]